MPATCLGWAGMQRERIRGKPASAALRMKREQLQTDDRKCGCKGHKNRTGEEMAVALQLLCRTVKTHYAQRMSKPISEKAVAGQLSIASTSDDKPCCLCLGHCSACGFPSRVHLTSSYTTRQQTAVLHSTAPPVNSFNQIQSMRQAFGYILSSCKKHRHTIGISQAAAARWAFIRRQLQWQAHRPGGNLNACHAAVVMSSYLCTRLHVRHTTPSTVQSVKHIYMFLS